MKRRLMNSSPQYPTEVIDKLSRNYTQEIRDNTVLVSKYSQEAKMIKDERNRFLQSIHATLNEFLEKEQEAEKLKEQTMAKGKELAGEQQRELDMLMKKYMKEQRKEKRIKTLAEKEAKMKEAEIQALQGIVATFSHGTISSSSPPLPKDNPPPKSDL